VRFRNRLLAGVLGVGFPITVLVVVLVVGTASSSVTQARDGVLVETAQRVAADIDAFTFERRRDLEQYAAALDHRLDESAGDVIGRMQRGSTAFKVVELLDLQGRFIAAAPPADAFAPGSRAWFRDASVGAASSSPRYRAGDTERWVIAEPVRDNDNRIIGVLAGDVETRALDAIITGSAPPSGRIDVVDNDARIVTHTGTAQTRPPARAVSASLAKDAGPIHTRSVIAGVAPVRGSGWGVIALQPRSVAWKAVHDLRTMAVATTVVGLFLFLAFGWLFARGEEWRIRAIVDQRAAGPRHDVEEPVQV
jgi:hypothetical protein